MWSKLSKDLFVIVRAAPPKGRIAHLELATNREDKVEEYFDRRSVIPAFFILCKIRLKVGSDGVHFGQGQIVMYFGQMRVNHLCLVALRGFFQESRCCCIIPNGFGNP